MLLPDSYSNNCLFAFNTLMNVGVGSFVEIKIAFIGLATRQDPISCPSALKSRGVTLDSKKLISSQHLES